MINNQESFYKEMELCNELIENGAKSKLGNIYEMDLSLIMLGEETVELSDFVDVYMLYSWRVFYQQIRMGNGLIFSSANYTLSDIEKNNIILNRDMAGSNYHMFMYFICMILLEIELFNGRISFPANNNQSKYLEAFECIKSRARDVEDFLNEKGVGGPRFGYLNNGAIVYFTRRVFDDVKASKAFEKLNEFEASAGVLDLKIAEQKKIISEINVMKSTLDTYKTEFNFVGLSKAFSNMRDKKKSDYNSSRRNFLWMVVALVLLPIVALIASYQSPVSGWFSLVHLLPFATLELIFIYLLRLFYVEGNSVQAQLLQIDLRLSLCEFIQDYVTYRSSNKDSSEVLKGFEALIFSPIQSSGDNIPSMLDGANILADFAGKVMKGKGGA
ncbi:hypothetical protein IM876_15805 [Serratia plymuthica]|uniref:hypothetical protein n=1 Tax=Serratia plymuthica TaxID=82996 RepID=UPI001926D8DF|nr:hypothetical protein [Serratia plymuthica]MBL3524143.1 hypothetical protein [Serratia plymuthica]